MSTISFGGLATGLDTGSIISQLVAIRRLPITRMEERQKICEQQISALKDLKTKLLALRTAAAALDIPSEFAALAASSNDEGLLTATANGLAAPGRYDIVINSLASYQKDISAGYASLAENVGTGTVSVTVGGETTDIELSAAVNSLSDLQSAINDAGLGVYATLLNDGSDTTPYRLVLTSAESGDAAAYTVDFSGLSGGTAPVLTNVSVAQNASLTIDSIPVTSASNNVSSAVTGLTLNLLDADPDTSVTVSVETDPSAIEDKIQALVDAYNDLFTYLADQSSETGTLQGHSALRTVRNSMQQLFALPLTEAAGSLCMLAQVGISQAEGGQIAFDREKFAEALGDSFTDVRDLFVQRGENQGKAYLVRTAIDNLTDSVDGLFQISTKGLQAQIDNLDDSIARYERSVESYQTLLERKFTAMESTVAALQSQGDYLYAALIGLATSS
jgi:flagellar hook-associated protein 2